VKKTYALLLTIILLFFTGCEDKKSQTQDIPVENTTEIISQQDTVQHNTNKKNANHKKTMDHPTVTTSSSTPFILTDSKQKKYTIYVDNKHITSTNIREPVILINLFATWCSPCKGEIPYLADLQKKYKSKLFVAGVLVNDVQDNTALEKFIQKYHANYYISNNKQNNAFAEKLVKSLQLPQNFPLPLTILYKEGNYYIHYEGAVPIEMIEHDIQEIIK
jgi:thiol-disulfide isomerase/thioredoxin